MRRRPTRSTHVWLTWIGVAYIALGAWWAVDGRHLLGACFVVLGIAFVVVHRRKLSAYSRSEQSR